MLTPLVHKEQKSWSNFHIKVISLLTLFEPGRGGKESTQTLSYNNYNMITNHKNGSKFRSAVAGQWLQCLPLHLPDLAIIILLFCWFLFPRIYPQNPTMLNFYLLFLGQPLCQVCVLSTAKSTKLYNYKDIWKMTSKPAKK